jgi:hypothetical protein
MNTDGNNPVARPVEDAEADRWGEMENEVGDLRHAVARCKMGTVCLRCNGLKVALLHAGFRNESIIEKTIAILETADVSPLDRRLLMILVDALERMIEIAREECE